MAIYIGSYALMGIVGIIIPKIIINKKMQRVFFAWFGGILLFLLFAFRHQSMGIDLGYKKDIGYLASFDKISTFSWKQTWNVKVYHYERGYIIFNKVVSAVWNNRQFFLAVSIYKRNSANGWAYFLLRYSTVEKSKKIFTNRSTDYKRKWSL